MSTTHHPPYKAPSNYSGNNIDLTGEEKKRLRNLAKDEELNEVMNTLRYANDQLGRFISWVKSKPVGLHTIIAATGDHNIRGIGYPDPHELVLGHAVPFYIYVPQNYRQNSYFDTNRVEATKISCQHSINSACQIRSIIVRGVIYWQSLWIILGVRVTTLRFLSHPKVPVFYWKLNFALGRIRMVCFLANQVS